MLYGTIYGLYDPQTDELRYIGQTITSLKTRLQSHIYFRNGKTHCNKWIMKLYKQNLIPIIKPITYAKNQIELDNLSVSIT